MRTVWLVENAQQAVMCRIANISLSQKLNIARELRLGPKLPSYVRKGGGRA